MNRWMACLALVAGVAHAQPHAAPDPYRWMEGEGNARFAAWLAEEGAAARQALDALPAHRLWAERLARLGQAGVQHRLHTTAGSRVLALRSQGGAEAVLVALEASGRERVLLAPEPPEQAITTFSVAPDGRTVAANLRRSGGEVTRIVFVDVASGRLLPDALDDVQSESAAAWRPDSRSVSYVQLAPPAERDATDLWLHQRVRLHRLGSSAERDPVLLARGQGDAGLPLAPHEAPSIQWPGAGLALAVVGGAQPQMRLCTAAAAAAARGQARWVCMAHRADEVVQAQAQGRTLYFVSTRGASAGRLLALTLRASAELADARELLPEAPGAVLTDFAIASDGLYVQRMQGAKAQLLRLPALGGGRFGAAQGVPLPMAAAISRLEADARVQGVLLQLQGWTMPPQAWHYRPDAAEIWQELPMGTHGMPAFAGVTAERVSVQSADGTAVPMTVLRRADAAPGATALLEGYGGYGVALEPTYDPYRLAFALSGQVVAYCHTRGGGELGEAWRVAGQGANKARAVDDFIACADALKQRGWAERVVAQGASMGGLLVGGALARAPQHFAGAIVQSGLLDPTRLAAAINGANQFAELGDPRTSAGLAQLQALDPLRLAEDGLQEGAEDSARRVVTARGMADGTAEGTAGVQTSAPWPPVLLMVGTDDQRVAPWQSGRFAQRLRAAALGSRVWLRTEPGGGHFATSGRLLAQQWADQFAFALSL